MAFFNGVEQGAIPANATRIVDIVFPGDANHHGTLFGGAGFSLMDRAAFIAASRHGRAPFVTASCERIDFQTPAKIGQIIELTSWPVRAGRKSLKVNVRMVAEDMVGGHRALCTQGSFSLVAKPTDPDWRMPPLPPLQEAPNQDGAIRMSEIVFSDQANSFGRMFGGEALAAMTKAAFVAATRFSRRVAVVVSSRQIDFRHPIAVGSILELAAKVVKVGRSSMVVAVELWSEGLLTGERRLTTEGEFVMVAVDEHNRPVKLAN